MATATETARPTRTSRRPLAARPDRAGATRVPASPTGPTGPPADLAAQLTPADREFVAAATGYPPAAHRGPTGAGSATPSRALLQRIAADRRSGALRGEVNAEYFTRLYARASAAGCPIPSPLLYAGLAYLATRSHRPAANR